MRIRTKGYGAGALVFDETAQVDPGSAYALAEYHSWRLRAYDGWMLEVEFLDEPNPQARYLRVGTDKALMVDPLPVTPAFRAQLELRGGRLPFGFRERRWAEQN